jgi:hypothetical protein
MDGIADENEGERISENNDRAWSMDGFGAAVANRLVGDAPPTAAGAAPGAQPAQAPANAPAPGQGEGQQPPAAQQPVEGQPPAQPAQPAQPQEGQPPAGEQGQQPAEGAQPPAPAAPVLDETDFRPAYDAVQKIGGLEELEVMSAIAAPLVASDPDWNGFVSALEANRGPDALNGLFWTVYDEASAEFLEEMLAHPDQVGGDIRQIRDPQRRDQVLALRSELQAFNGWRSSGRPAVQSAPASAAPTAQPAPSPAGTATQPTAVTVPEIGDLDEYDMPAKLRGQIDQLREVAQTLANEVPGLQKQVNDLRGYQETETQRRDRETREAQNRERVEARQVTQEREGRLYGAMDAISTRMLEQVRFSTQADPARAQAEDEETRRDIDARVTTEFGREIHQSPETSAVAKAWQGAIQKYRAGDFVGARADVQTLKERVQGLTRAQIERHSGRLVAATTAAPAVTTTENNRTQVSGPGSGAAPQLPASPTDTSPAWSNLGSEFERRMSQRKRA